MFAPLHLNVLSPTEDRKRSLVGYVALVAAVITLGLLVALYQVEPVKIVPMPDASELFGSGLRFYSSAMMRPLALTLALVTCSAILLSFSRPDEPSPWFLSVALASLAIGLASLWAANVLTMIVSWAIYDLLKAAGHIAAGGSRRGAVRGLVFGGVATLLLWIGMLLADVPTSSGQWAIMTFGEAQMRPWTAAGLIRLWIYPLHTAAPDDLDVTSPLAALIFALSPVIGWGLWLRLAAGGSEAFTADSWWLVLTVLAVGVTGFLSWASASLRRSLLWIAIAANGTVLLAAGLAAEEAVSLISAGSITWLLGVVLLLLSASLSTRDALDAYASWLYFPSLVGALALIGWPLTLGFVTEAALLEAFFANDHLGWAGIFFIGRMFLIPALARWFVASWSAKPGEALLEAVRGLPTAFSELRGVNTLLAPGLGLGGPALLLIVTGVYPALLFGDTVPFALGALFRMPGWTGWLLWGAAFLGGSLLAWREEELRSRIALGLSAIADFLRLEWLYEALVGALERALAGLRIFDEIVGGAGTLLWSWIVFLLMLLLWLSR